MPLQRAHEALHDGHGHLEVAGVGRDGHGDLALARAAHGHAPPRALPQMVFHVAHAKVTLVALHFRAQRAEGLAQQVV